ADRPDPRVEHRPGRNLRADASRVAHGDPYSDAAHLISMSHSRTALRGGTLPVGTAPAVRVGLLGGASEWEGSLGPALTRGWDSEAKPRSPTGRRPVPPAPQARA